MTPKEKAEDLINKFKSYSPIKLSDYTKVEYPSAIQFAIIVVNEVLGYMGSDRGYSFWIEVKEELEKM